MSDDQSNHGIYVAELEQKLRDAELALSMAEQRIAELEKELQLARAATTAFEQKWRDAQLRYGIEGEVTELSAHAADCGFSVTGRISNCSCGVGEER